MNSEKGREIVERYREALIHHGTCEGPYDEAPSDEVALLHAHGMLDKMDGFLDRVEEEDCYRDDLFYNDSDRVKQWDKFNRWLGFVQGVFWMYGTYTLDEMKEHNRT